MRFYGEKPLPDEIHLDLFFLNRDLALTGIPCRKIFEARVDKGQAGQVPEWYVGLQFQNPKAEMLEALRKFRWTEDHACAPMTPSMEEAEEMKEGEQGS